MARILVIDDDVTIARSFKRLLEDHAVEIETDAPTALARITNHEPFDVIICDVWMPRMNGPDVLRKMLSLPERPIFILMTGDEDAVGGSLGVDGILIKPFGRNELRGLIRSLLELRARSTTRRLPVMDASTTATPN